MNEFFSDTSVSLLFNLNLTLFALFGAIVVIILTIATINKKSLLLRSVLYPYWTVILILLSANLCFLFLSKTYFQQIFASMSAVQQRRIAVSIGSFNLIILILFVLFSISLPFFINPIRLLRKTCEKLRKILPILVKEIDDFRNSQQLYHSIDLYLKDTIDIFPPVHNSRVLSDISGLYLDIVQNGDYIQQREANRVLINSIKDIANQEYDHLYDDIILPYFFKRVENTLELNLDIAFYVELFDEIGFLLREIDVKKMNLSFSNSANLLLDIYRDTFRQLSKKIRGPISIYRLLMPYFVCLRIERQTHIGIYVLNMLEILKEIANSFENNYFQHIFSEFDKDIRAIYFESEDIRGIRLFTDLLYNLFSYDRVASCKYHADNAITSLLTTMRRIQDSLKKNAEGNELSIEKYDLIASLIQKLFSVKRERIIDPSNDIKKGMKKFDEG